MEVTFDLGWLISAVFIPILWLISRKINDNSAENKKLADELGKYKLDAERRFASVGHLQEVEKRLADEFKGLREDVKDLTRSVNLVLRSHGEGD